MLFRWRRLLGRLPWRAASGDGGLRRIDEATGEIRRMRVHPYYQRQGLGQAVLTALEERARQLGYTRVVLDTSDRQEAARALYEKNDCRETGREKRRVGETRVFLILYEKELTSTAVDLEPQL
ncbi:MAG: GNAT family N-acetyltransferase [Chloroflexi bacterium]|nr:GNAT family N-acetyltransferase [Chloroflexota bacterium]